MRRVGQWYPPGSSHVPRIPPDMPTADERDALPSATPVPAPGGGAGSGPETTEDRSRFLSEYRRLLKAVKVDHADTKRHLDLARFLIDNGYHDRAHSPLRAARALQPRRLETQYVLASLYAKQSNFQQAQLTYRQILEINPNEAQAHYHLGTSLLKLSRQDEALPALMRAVELDSKLTGAYWHLGELALKRDDFQLALRYYQTLKTLEPDSPELYFRLGEVQRLRGLSDRAVIAYQKSLQLKPTHVKARLALARLYLEGDLPSRSQEILEEVMEWDHRPAETFILLAQSYKEQSENSQALATLLKMATLFPDDPRSHRELAKAYFLEGEIVLAGDIHADPLELLEISVMGNAFPELLLAFLEVALGDLVDRLVQEGRAPHGRLTEGDLEEILGFLDPRMALFVLEKFLQGILHQTAREHFGGVVGSRLLPVPTGHPVDEGPFVVGLDLALFIEDALSC